MSLLCISREDQTDTQSQFTLNQLRQYSNALFPLLSFLLTLARYLTTAYFWEELNVFNQVHKKCPTFSQ